MVRWSEWLSAMSGSMQVSVSGSYPDGSYIPGVGTVGVDPGLSGADKTVVASIEHVPSDTPHENVIVKVGPTLNEGYYTKIHEILDLAINFDSTSESVSQIKDILSEYVRSGVLTKEEMLFLNRMYKLFTFEAKYHPDKQTTVGRIKEILGGLNG
jgi:hypothetical protein